MLFEKLSFLSSRNKCYFLAPRELKLEVTVVLIIRLVNLTSAPHTASPISMTMIKSYPRPHSTSLAGIDPATATTEQLIALARSHRQDPDYPTGEQLLANLPVTLHSLGDYVLSGQATALAVAYSLASLIDAIDHRLDRPHPSRHTH